MLVVIYYIIVIYTKIKLIKYIYIIFLTASLTKINVNVNKIIILKENPNLSFIIVQLNKIKLSN